MSVATAKYTQSSYSNQQDYIIYLFRKIQNKLQKAISKFEHIKHFRGLVHCYKILADVKTDLTQLNIDELPWVMNDEQIAQKREIYTKKLKLARDSKDSDVSSLYIDRD